MLPSNSTTLAGLVGEIVGLINQLIALLGGIALLFFLWGCVQYVIETTGGHSGRGKGTEKIQWGLVALFVFFSIWGIIRILQSVFLN